MKVRYLLLVMLLLLCSGCDNNSDKRVVNILNWSSYIPSEVILDFEEKTGIDVNYGTYSSNEELLAKVSVAKEGTYDLVFPSDYMVEVMINRGLLEKINNSKLNNDLNINRNFMNLDYDPYNSYTLPFVAASTVIAVNREIISDEIDSYNDLLDPKYKGEVVLIDDQRIIIGVAFS